MEAFERVQQAETKSISIINAAKREAMVIIEEAERNAAGIIDGAVKKAREDAALRISEAGRDSQNLTDALRTDLEEEKRELIKKSNASRNAAVQKILDAIAG